VIAGHGGAQWLHKDERSTLTRKGYLDADGALTEQGAAELERISLPLSLSPHTPYSAPHIVQGGERICTTWTLRRAQRFGETQDGRHVFVKLEGYAFMVPPELLEPAP
jgi:hypothetical protein